MQSIYRLYLKRNVAKSYGTAKELCPAKYVRIELSITNKSDMYLT